LTNMVNGNYNEINRNIIILKEQGIVIERRQNGKRLLKLNQNNKKTLQLIEILKTFEKMDGSEARI